MAHDDDFGQNRHHLASQGAESKLHSVLDSDINSSIVDLESQDINLATKANISGHSPIEVKKKQRTETMRSGASTTMKDSYYLATS